MILKKIFLFFWIGFLFSIPLIAAPGIVIETEGSVLINIPEKKVRQALLGMEFPDGTRIKTGQESFITFLLMDGQLKNLGPETEYKVERKKVLGEKKIEWLAAIREAVRQTGSGPTLHGILKITPGVPLAGELQVLPFAGGIEPIFPNNTSLEKIPETMVFQWSGKKIEEKKSIFVLLEPGQKHQMFKVKADQKSIELKPKKLGLELGKTYHWYLGYKKKGRPIAVSQTFSFKILNTKEETAFYQELIALEKVPLKTEGGRDFLKAQVEIHYGLYFEALQLLEPLYRQYETMALRRLLLLVNSRLGRLSEAKELQNETVGL